MILCFQSPALAPQSHSHLRNQRNRRSSHTYRFPAGTLRKNRLFPRLMLPWKGKTTMEGPHEVQGGLSKPHGAPTRLLSMSRCVPVCPSASQLQHLPPCAAGSSNPARKSRWVHREGDPRPTWGREERPTGNDSLWESFPPVEVGPIPSMAPHCVEPQNDLFPL